MCKPHPEIRADPKNPLSAPKAAITTEDCTRYDALTAKLAAGDVTDVDFVWLRHTDLRIRDYHVDDADAMRPAFAALNKQDYAQALDLAEGELAKDIVNLPAHVVADIALGHLNRPADKARHHAIGLGLFRAVTGGRDGHSAEQAWDALSVGEEYFVLSMRGLKPNGQALVPQGGHNFDRMDVIDTETGKPETIWFNIDAFFAHELG